MRTLPPQRLRAQDYAKIEAQLVAIFGAVLFKPVLELLEAASAQVKAEEVLNAGGGWLVRAIRSGLVQYKDGVFSGTFNRRLADQLRDMGATFDAMSKVYRMDQAVVPAWVKAEAGAYASVARSAHDAVLSKLSEVKAGLDKALSERPVKAKTAIDGVEDGFKVSAQSLAIKTEIEPSNRARIEREYSEDIAPYVSDAVKGFIDELHETVTRNAEQGYRFDKLVDGIKRRYNTSTYKARFLARQETALFMSRYRRERFKEAGVGQYRWSGAMDARERHDHKALQGKIFSYDNPPIVNRATGKRANPGEDFNCRCLDIPILSPVAAGALG